MAMKMLMLFAAFSFVAWILLFLGLAQRRESRRRNELERNRTTGCIVDYVRGESPAGKGRVRVYWKPVVEFMADGQKFQAEYENSMDRERFPIGETVDILYDVSDPSRFHLEADPVFVSGGRGAIRISIFWILASAVLTVVLAVFIGGLSLDFPHMWHSFREFLRSR